MGKKYIQSGWASYLSLVVPADAPPIQISETKQAFFSGASILFKCLLDLLDPGQGETDADMQMMEDIAEEIQAFGQQLDKDVLKLVTH